MRSHGLTGWGFYGNLRRLAEKGSSSVCVCHTHAHTHTLLFRPRRGRLKAPLVWWDEWKPATQPATERKTQRGAGPLALGAGPLALGAGPSRSPDSVVHCVPVLSFFSRLLVLPLSFVSPGPVSILSPSHSVSVLLSPVPVSWICLRDSGLTSPSLVFPVAHRLHGDTVVL